MENNQFRDPLRLKSFNNEAVIVKCGSITQSIFSGGTPDTREPSYWNGELSWLSSGETREKFITRTEKKITKAGVMNSSTKLAKVGDIVIASAGQGYTRGQSSFCMIDTYVNQSIIVVRPDPDLVDGKFLFYVIQNLYDELRNVSDSHSSRGSLTCEMIRDLDVLLFPIEEQHVIAHVLGTLDDKIELNRKMNETLEAIARALFKSWFIDFDPVRAKMEGRKPFGMDDETAALFPDSFEDSELGEIPKGWRIQRVDSLLELKYGKPCNYSDDASRGIPTYGSNGQIGWTDQALVKGPGIIVGRKGSSGVVKWSFSDFFPIDTTFFVCSKIGHEAMRYLYHVLDSLNMPNLTINAGVPGLNRNDAHSQLIAVPPIEIIHNFCSIINPFIVRITLNEMEISSLSSIRDKLLPKLISGEIRLPPFRDDGGE